MKTSNYESLKDTHLLTVGSCDTINELFKRHYNRVLNIAYSICRHRNDAEEVTQDTFIKASKSLSKFRFDSKFSTWLHRITMNTALDLIKKRKKKSLLKKDFAELQKVLKGENKNKHIQELREAIETLPNSLRKTLELVVYEGFNHKETANILGCAETTISWRIFQAKKKLKKKLNKR